MEDSFEDALTAYIEENYNVVFDDNKIHKAVVNVARKNVFNPVKNVSKKLNGINSLDWKHCLLTF